MIILSVGMPRAGSGWYYNLTNDIIQASGAQDAREIRQRYHLQGILTEVNCNIGTLSARRVLSVMLPSLLGNTFVIKAHSGPTKVALQFIHRDQIKPTYIYRDPRDALLSVIENGRRALERGRPNAFSPYTNFNDAITFIETYLQIGMKWLESNAALHVRYEDLLLNYSTEINRLIDFLDLDQERIDFSKIIDHYRPESGQTEGKGLHFSHGKIGRFRTKLTTDQQAQIHDRLKTYIHLLGYE